MNRIVARLLCAVTTIGLCGGTLAAEQTQAPQTVPQDQQEKSSGTSLSSRLDHANGVIRPPSGIDPGAVQLPPPSGRHSTPVIPPLGAGGDEDVHPK